MHRLVYLANSSFIGGLHTTKNTSQRYLILNYQKHFEIGKIGELYLSVSPYIMNLALPLINYNHKMFYIKDPREHLP